MARILYLGTPDFAVPCLKALATTPHEIRVLSQMDRPQGRKQILLPTAVKAAALELGLTLMQPERIAAAEVEAEIRAWEPDLMVVVAYGQILPQRLLDIPRLGAVNLHPSRLPRWRGSCPIESCLRVGERDTALSLIRLTKRMDAGPILAQWPYQIAAGADAARVRQDLAEFAAERFLEVLEDLLASRLPESPQEESEACYCEKMTRESGRLDFRQEAQDLENHLLAMQPWPGTFTFFLGERIKIWRLRALTDSAPTGARAGEIIAHKEGLIVACGQGLIEILDLQKASGKRLEARLLFQQFPVGGIFAADDGCEVRS